MDAGDVEIEIDEEQHRRIVDSVMNCVSFRCFPYILRHLDDQITIQKTCSIHLQ